MKKDGEIQVPLDVTVKILNKNTDLVENVAEECRDKVNDLVQETMEEQLQEKFAKYDNVAQSF